ncbi:helix-turn-helix domain-containing protein [Brevundimonas sp. FT23042]|uniref:helix-turn-helix domain-containing protein n=1 Tax=Brevundimonas sp. FT23042 TaxID=3393749 RepID=UPI003B587F2F
MSSRLSRRELQCLRLAAQELGNKDIAARLGIAPSTVENHLTNAYAKLGTSDRRIAAAIAVRDYPDISHFAPTPMAPAPSAEVVGEAPGEFVAAGRETGTASNWILPAPPRRPLQILAIILAFAAVGGVLTAGLVQLTAGGMSLLSQVAPPDAVRALDSDKPAGPRP